MRKAFRGRKEAKKMMADKEVNSTAEASTGRRPSNRGFQVFLSFHGTDSRFTVVDLIVDALNRAEVPYVYDRGSTRQGEVIKGELREAIINSTIYILIFSKNYASRRRCLRELELITECWEGKVEEKTIIPIFHDVDENLISKLYTNALKKHEKELGENVVKPWRVALENATTISGFHTRKHGLTELTKLVMEEVCCKLGNRSDPEKVSADAYVGIDDPMEEVIGIMDLDAQDVRFVAIHGTDGIGKTTLVRLVFRKISSDFPQGVAFLSDVREKFRTGGIVKLQKKLLSQLGLGQVKKFPCDADGAAEIIKTRVRGKKVLIVLDDLDNSEQLLKLAGKTSWFGIGSRIILTTQNIGALPKHNGLFPYEMQEMKFDDALKLFSRHVFGRDSPPEGYNKISREVVDTFGRLPLSINTIAPILGNTSKSEWKNIIKKKVVRQDEGGASTGRGRRRGPSSSSRDCDIDIGIDCKLKLEVYTTAVQAHKDELGKDVVKPWENALQKVTKIQGWDLRNHRSSDREKRRGPMRML